MRKSEITVDVVEGLVASQFPERSNLPVTPLEIDGWDNTTFRLGSSMSVRLPSADSYAAQVDVWVHGDVTGANLLVREGRLAAVLDFGCSGFGDPACDLTIAWTFLSDDSRARFMQLCRSSRQRGRAGEVGPSGRRSTISPPIEPTPARDGDVIVASAGGSAPAMSSPR